ncbi:sugar kinase [Natrarchaeobius halalkaliphilus]|uniref:Pantoate kinase n=1 Tax=Natrarchaeobius halalkaliphilus TaxID=1679091 RepID=A0A3N6LSA7_9EURY|nr:pantoate kinase [Natrarchaeobius halalkaliphilus]RQG90144.1 sugar kinase [Natrarchaeobius halalkaliphilus]
MREEATAFVPGHITGFFSAHTDTDPTKAGSRGAGVTLTDGVDVTVRRHAGANAADSSVVLDGESITVEPVSTVLETLGVSARVEAEADLPLGAGFGVSGALTLGTALAANRVFERNLSWNELVTIAHGAEVQAGTGLGDVVAQAYGGIPIRLEPGGPQVNRMDAIPERARVEYVSFGELSTEAVLAGDMEAVTAAGKQALSRVVEEPTLLSFIYASRVFAREAGLLTDRVKTTIDDVSDAGGQASMAMLGETVFAFGTGLSDAGYEPTACATHPAGAMIR